MATAATIQSTEAPAPDGIKETLESIVVALILAFVFRAFIVEAFVIPTGSMAPTLYGAHGVILCQDCGMEFAYGVRDPDDTRRTVPVRAGSRAICPNCNHVNTNLRINDENGNAERGDRILVLKWPLDVGAEFLEPKRWEVTVFKDPADGTTNFIKRLIGLPNEVLMILDGDIYTVPVEKLSSGAMAELEQIRHEKAEFRAKLRSGRLRSVSAKTIEELNEKMTIARKTPPVQEALWFPVYNHDFPPQTPDPHQPRWAPGAGGESGWNAASRRVRFTDAGRDDDYITLRGKSFRASCAYNVNNMSRAPVVTDLRVSFVLTPQDGRGAVRVRLGKHKRVFWATIHMNGLITLVESPEPPTPDAPVMVQTEITPFLPGRPVELSFENVDYRLALRLNGEEVLASSDDPASPAYYAPDIRWLRRYRSQDPIAPRLYAWRGDFEIAHLTVERDAHYYHEPRAQILALRWAPSNGWASPDNPILLRDKEYFMLGDNTAASKDSRLWDVTGKHLAGRGDAFQLGTVPRDQLIGQAFFVYWPSGHRLEWLPLPVMNRWGVIPDVGRMRCIR